MKNKPPVALITGGAKRIGAVIAGDLAQHGFQVAIHYHQAQDEALALVNEITRNGGIAKAFQADLLQSHGVGLIEDVNAALGPVRLLINNASLFIDDHIGQLDEVIWNNHFALHLRTPAILADSMDQQLNDDEQSLIINMIDQRVLKLNPNFLSYTLSKSALWTLTQTLAQALAPKIRVNAIGPGPSLKSPRQNSDDFAKQCKSVLLQHGPKLEDFGATVRYFWQQTSITGQMIALDGGQHLMWQTPDIMGLIE